MEHYDSDDAETGGQVRMHSCNQPCFTGLSHAGSTSVLYVLLLIYGQLLLQLANPQPGQRAALPADARSERHLVSARNCSQSSYHEVSGLLRFSLQVVGLFGDSKHPGMAYHSRPEDDPYITQHDDSDSEKDDFVLKGTDRLILAARNEDDVNHLEVSVFTHLEALHEH